MTRTAPLCLAAIACVLCTLILAVPVSASEPEPPMPESLMFTPPNTTEVEIGFLYSHFSKNRLVVNGYSFYDVIIIGHLKVDEVRRDIMVPSLTLRYGLSPRANLEAVIPFRYRIDNALKYGSQEGETGQPTEETFSRAGLGDIELSLNLDTRFVAEGSSPFITTIAVKTVSGVDPYSVAGGERGVPLGTGHWGARLGFATMKRFDPVVLFVGASYFWNIARDVEGYGTVDPGDTIQYSLGMGYALTRNFAVACRLEHSYTNKTVKAGVVQADSDANAATLYVGVSYSNERGSGCDLAVGIGLTEDSPDFTLRLGLPIRF